MTRPGYIYALINYSMPGLIKVGFTTRSAEERATELSAATSVPTPFVVAYDILVPDGAGGERRIHERLEEQGYRVSDDREFFNAPLRRIIGAMIAVREELSRDRFEWDEPPVTEPTIAEPTIPGRDVHAKWYNFTLFSNAADLCVRRKQGSTSLLVRELDLMPPDAEWIVNLLEHVAILGPPDGSKARDVLVRRDEVKTILASVRSSFDYDRRPE